MVLFKQIKRFYKENTYEVWITIIVFSNLFQQWIPSTTYFIGLFLFALKYMRYKHHGHPQRVLYNAFIVLLWFSSVVGLTIDLRLVVFTFILIITAPSKSLRWHLYKLKLLRCIYWGFAVVTLLNFYAKLIGYNYLDLFRDEYFWASGKVGEFSGFGRFAMWTSCAAAISTMVFVSYAFTSELKSNFRKFICYAMTLISLYVTMISASRSAFFLSLACSLIVIKMQTKKFSGIIRNLIIIAVTISVFAPVLIDNSEAMMNKKNGLEITTQNTSRDELWGNRMEEFWSSPVIGIGFAAHGVGLNKQIGRTESGGSFISVLAQSGIIGFSLIFLIWVAATNLPHHIPDNQTLILTYGAFLFMSVHCIFEGYMFQAGWYMCFIIWLVVGVMIENKTFRQRRIQ